MTNPETRRTILSILDEELRDGGGDRFLGSVSTFVDEDHGTIFGLLEAFRTGIAEWK